MESLSGGRGMFFLGALCFALVRGLVNSQMTMRSTTTSAVRDPREFCAADEFTPRCSDQQVVMITEAMYGRMTFGECVKQDYGYLGCSNNILDQMDDFCSGKRNCSLKIPHPIMEEVNICPKEFKAYLNVSFECIEVEKSACNGCSPLSRSSVAKTTRSRGFIGSVATLESPSGICGSAQCPWYIEVQSGQTINLTLYDFSNKHAVSSGISPGQCTRLAVIKEAAHLKETPVCYRQNRVQQVYSSVSQSIQIHVVSKEVLKTKGQFLIRYEVIGCPDLQPPENAVLKRMGDRVIVECRDASHGLRWESRCVDSRWEGEIGTCPGSSLQTTLAPSFLTLPLGVLGAIVLGIALVIGVFIVTVGVVCLKRQQGDQLTGAGNVLYIPTDQCYELREDYTAGQSSTGGRKATGRCQEATGRFKEHHLVAGRRNVYAHTRMESRPLPSLPNLNEASSQQGRQGRVPHGSMILHAVEMGTRPGDAYPYHLRASTLGRTSQGSQKSNKCSKNSKRRVEGRGGSGGSGGGRGGRCGGGPAMHSNIPASAFSAFSGAGISAPTSSGASSTALQFGSAVPQHYTVLDPIEVQQQLTGTLRTGNRPVASSSSSSSQGQSAIDPRTGCCHAGASPSTAPPKPPLMPSVSVFQGVPRSGRWGAEGETENSFCREISFRPPRQNITRARTNEHDLSSSGNSSWP